MAAPIAAVGEVLEQAGKGIFRRKSGNSSGGRMHRKQKRQKR